MRWFALGSMVVALAWTATGGADPEVVEQVAAEVNGERIMLSEVVRELRDKLAALPADLPPEARRRRKEALVRARLVEMIQRRLILQVADRELNEAQKRAIDGRVQDRLKALTEQVGSREVVVERLRAEGRTLDDLTADLRRQITISAYLAAKIRPGVHITRRQMIDYYRRHRSEFEQPEWRTWRIITIRPDKFARPADARVRAEQIKKRLAEGADFAALARQFSHGPRADRGGLWGPMARSEFAIAEVVNAVFTLQAGQVSPIIETAAALHVVKVEAIEPARKASFADVQDEIRKRLRNLELARRHQELMRRLERHAFIRVCYTS